MISFEQFWQLMYEHGSRNYYKHDTSLRWAELSPEQQDALYKRISEKIRVGKFVDFNPLEAIHDNIPRQRTQYPNYTPTNYNGKALPDEAMVIARYNGVGGLYTAREARLFGMEIIKDFEP